MTIQLVVGLGNPGPEYTKTRHNAGVWFVEELARVYNISLRPEKNILVTTVKVKLVVSLSIFSFQQLL